MVWLDRLGHEMGTIGEPAEYPRLRLSPDGGRVLFSRSQPRIGTYDLWLFDGGRGVEQRVTMDRLSEYSAVWLPAGRATVFSGGVPPHLFRKDLVTGVEEQLIAAPRFTTAEDVSPDGKTLIFLQRTPRGTFDLWKMTPDAPQSASPMRQTPFDKSNARFSPDGRYIAFASNELGRYEVFVSPFPMTGEATRVSKGGRRSSPLESRRPRALLRLGRSSLGRRARPNVAVTRPGLSSTTVRGEGRQRVERPARHRCVGRLRRLDRWAPIPGEHP